MMYKIVLSNTKENIPVNTDEELGKIMEGIARGDKIVMCKQGTFNLSFLVAILPDWERNNDEFRYLKSPEEIKRKEEELRAGPSPFAKALAEKFKILTPASRTAAQEDAAREERKLK